jgi:hypothetical protein
LVTQRLVRLSKTQGSSDNITIIVVFLKDPHIIATSSWPSESIPFLSENMDTAYDANQESQKNLFDMDYEIKTTTGEFTGKLLPSDIDNENYNNGNGNENLLDYVLDNSAQLSTTTTTEVLTTKATNGKRSADDLIDEEYDEDLGPETDVDALDEVMMSPKEVKQEQQVESKDVDEVETTKATTEHIEEATSLLINEAAKKLELNSDLIGNIISVDGTNPFEDNKIRDLLDDDEVEEMKVTSELVDRVTNELLLTRDISIEKQDQSFEKDDIDDIVTAKEDITQETVISQVLETSAAAEHHAVAESGGEDSEDEWNYFKGDKKSITTTTETIEEDEQKELQEEIEESHALSQAVAESQEACSDLISSEQDDGLEQELIDIEKNSAIGLDKFKEKSPQHELASLTEEQNEDIDDDEMSSQLNPDAKEFVPTSPVRSTNQSPFNLLNQNGASLNTHQPAYLFDEDNIIAQSPRKGTPMDDITLPAETDFDIEISRRPAELEAQNGEPANVERPGSSSSQASYQEMNLKEAMHGDEKLEYAPEVDDLIEQAKENVDAVVSQLTANVLSETDPMNMSFYQDNDNDIINPFDLNSVQRLPLDDEFEGGIVKPENTQKIIFESEQGQRFVIEDNDFGMQENLISQDEISKPEDDMYSPVSDNKIIDDNADSNLESDKPESELLLQDKTHEILEQVTEEVLQLGVTETYTENATKFQSENFLETVTTEYNDESNIEINNSSLITTGQKELESHIIPQETEEQAESESSFLRKSEKHACEEILNHLEPRSVPDLSSEFIHDNLADASPLQEESPIVESVDNIETIHAGTPPPTPAILNVEVQPKISTPEPHEIVEAVERLSFGSEEKPQHELSGSSVLLDHEASEPLATIECVASVLSQSDAKPIDELTESQVEAASSNQVESEPNITEAKEIDVVAVAGVAATTLGATAAIASVIVAEKENEKTNESVKSSKPASKPSTPSKAATKTGTAKKPATPTTKPASATKTSTTTSRPSSKPLSSSAALPKSSSTTAAKTATKTTVTLTKKPLTNGEAKTTSVVKKTTTTTSTTKTPENIAKSHAGSVRSTTTTTTTTRTISTAPRTATSTISKTTASKPAAAPRTATAFKATPATKPPTTISNRPSRPVTSTTSAPSATKTAAARTPLSPAKTKPSPTSTVTDKQSKDTTNKLRTVPSTLNPSKTATSTSRTGATAPARKVTDLKSPTAAKSRTATGATSGTTTTTTTTTKSSTIGRKPTTTTRTSITKKTTGTSAISKSGANDSKATKLTTVKLEKQLLNGDVISEKEIIRTTILDSNGDVILNEDNENIIRKDESPDHQSLPLLDNSQMIVIDSAAD